MLEIQNNSNLVKNSTRCEQLLMVSPEHYDVTYAINPFMKDEFGNLKKVDKSVALLQWKKLKETFESLKVKVVTLEGAHGFPDMVFCANQTLPFIDKNGRASVILSKMRSAERQGEVKHFENWFLENGVNVYRLQDPNAYFESNGDLIPQPGTTQFWGGAGPRTEAKVYEELRNRFGLNIVTLKLIDSNFYHLDTCFSIINQNTVAVIEEAIDADGINSIKAAFSNYLRIDYKEGLEFFTGNCFSPDGKNVVLNYGSKKFCETLRTLGLNPVEVDTSEFMKAGGSVFCMKLALI